MIWSHCHHFAISGLLNWSHSLQQAVTVASANWCKSQKYPARRDYLYLRFATFPVIYNRYVTNKSQLWNEIKVLVWIFFFHFSISFPTDFFVLLLNYIVKWFIIQAIAKIWSFSRPPQTEDMDMKVSVETERQGKNAKNIIALMHTKVIWGKFEKVRENK